MGWNTKKVGSTPLGDRLKQERIRRGYKSIKVFAHVVGVSHTQLSGIENRGRVPRVSSLIAICKVLDCSTDWLLGLEE